MSDHDLLNLSDAARVAAAPASAARRRKLHVGHFAFMRALVQGVHAPAAWDRYLRTEGDSGDVRLVRSTIGWIREEFAAAAKRQDRHGTARLVRLDVSKIPDPGVRLPTLEAFAEERGLEDESQAEQLAAYETEFGRRSQQLRRRGRLVERQLEALRWLEDLIAQPPRAGDSVAAWLDPGLAAHLEAADIFTLAQLIERINGIGRRWYAGMLDGDTGRPSAAKAYRVLRAMLNATVEDGVLIANPALRLGRMLRLTTSKATRQEEIKAFTRPQLTQFLEIAMVRDRPNPIVAAPKIATAPSILTPTSCLSGRKEKKIATRVAPSAGAARRWPRPVAPTWRMSRAKTGSIAVAPPSRTANRSSEIAPSTNLFWRT